MAAYDACCENTPRTSSFRNFCNSSMTDLVRNFNSFATNRMRPIPRAHCSTEAFTRNAEAVTQVNPSTSYTVDNAPSIFSDDVDRWLAGDNSAINTSVQSSRITTAARSTLTISSSLIDNGFWYTIAMLLPLLGCGNNWRCTPSFIFTSGEMVFTRLAGFCARTRDQMRSLAQDHVVREIFATAMDIVLIIYAIGFLVLSMCQASITGPPPERIR